MKKVIKKFFHILGFDLVRFEPNKKNVPEVEKAVPKIKPTVFKFHPYFIDKEVEGVKFKFFIGDTDGESWYHTGATDPHWAEMKFMKDNIVKKGDVVIECGSHHGCTAILLSEWVGEKGKVISFEPNPANFEIAKINISINKIKNVELLNQAVGAKCEEVQIDMTNSNSHVLKGSKSANVNYHTVQSINLDSLNDIHADVLKIDVEGFEKEVLIGAFALLKEKPKLAIEIHTDLIGKYNTSVDEIFDLLNREQYNFWIQWNDEEVPAPFNFEKKINTRVHLFALPK